MGRQRKRPSEYRFLLELQPTLYALAIAFFLYQIRDVPCIVSALAKVQQACQLEYPNYIWLGILAFALYGLAACVYRFYRDFFLGEYWMDLESGR